MPRFPGAYREPGRKTDYYMPPYAQGLDDYSFLEDVCTEQREERHRPPGKDAFRESLEHALRGDRHPTHVSACEVACARPSSNWPMTFMLRMPKTTKRTVCRCASLRSKKWLVWCEATT